MHKKTLRELAKFASGLIAGDFICGLWLYFGGYLPMSVFGITFSPQGVLSWLIFDAIFFAFLVHYGWGTAHRPRTSREKKFHMIAGIIFTLVAILHLSRIIFGWNFVLGSWNVPYWLNGLGTIIALFLAYASFSLASKE